MVLTRQSYRSTLLEYMNDNFVDNYYNIVEKLPLKTTKNHFNFNWLTRITNNVL